MLEFGTWNVHYATPTVTVVESVKDLFENQGMDVLCLQEVCFLSAREGWCRVTRKLRQATGCYVAAAPQTLPTPFWWEGLAIVSRFPIVQRKAWVLNRHRRYLQVQVDVGSRRLTVGCLHISAWARPWKEGELARILALLPESGAVLGGDFNLRPHDPLMRAAFERLQWDSSRQATNGKAKIDYLLATRDLQIDVSRLLPKSVSDHHPVVATIS